MFMPMMEMGSIDQEFVRAAAMRMLANGVEPKLAIEKAVALQEEYDKWRESEKRTKADQRERFIKCRDARLVRELGDLVRNYDEIVRKQSRARSNAIKAKHKNEYSKIGVQIIAEAQKIANEISEIMFDKSLDEMTNLLPALYHLPEIMAVVRNGKKTQ